MELHFRDSVDEKWLRKTNLSYPGRLFSSMLKLGKQQTSACYKAWPDLLNCRFKISRSFHFWWKTPNRLETLCKTKRFSKVQNILMQIFMRIQNIIMVVGFDPVFIEKNQVFCERRPENVNSILLCMREDKGKTKTFFYQNDQHKDLYKP